MTNPTGSRSARALLMVAFALAVVGAACSGDDSADEGADEATESESPSGSLAACDDLYQAGAVVTVEEAEAGCTLADGTTLVANAIECDDGRSLVTYEDSDPQIWGFTGEPLHAAEGGENASDPAYGTAFSSC